MASHTDTSLICTPMFANMSYPVLHYRHRGLNKTINISYALFSMKFLCFGSTEYPFRWCNRSALVQLDNHPLVLHIYFMNRIRIGSDNGCWWCICKYRLRNGGHFVQGEMSWWLGAKQEKAITWTAAYDPPYRRKYTHGSTLPPMILVFFFL